MLRLTIGGIYLVMERSLIEHCLEILSLSQMLNRKLLMTFYGLDGIGLLHL
uniref:Uncharacterized protein n=1 Tax=Solanum tuberosum TaxID=4113 RepID=M0ZR56_SOLTU